MVKTRADEYINNLFKKDNGSKYTPLASLAPPLNRDINLRPPVQGEASRAWLKIQLADSHY